MAKASQPKSSSGSRRESLRQKRAKRSPNPVEIQLTMAVNFSDDPDEAITVVDNRELRMVGSALKYRDKAIRFTLFNIVKAGMMQPSVAREIAPGVFSVLAMGKRGVRKVMGDSSRED